MKFRHIFLITFALFFTTTVQSQQLLPIKKEGKWGAIDPSGKIIVPAQYEFLGNFYEFPNKEQWATFRTNGKVGVVDDKGDIIIKNEYQQITICPNKTAVVWRDGKCGLANSSGKEIVEPTYNQIDFLNYNLFRMVFNNKIGISDNQGKVIHAAIFDKVEPFSIGYEVTKVTQGGKLGVIDLFGKLILPTEYDKVDLQQFKVTAQKDNQITIIEMAEGGEIRNQQTFNNQTALDLAKKKADLNAKKDLLAKNPDANKPQWVKEGFRYKLVDFFGKNLLNKEFFSLNIDDETGLSLGILENSEKDLECYLIQHNQAKILTMKKAKDLVLSDFRESNYARISLDTLWDGLINKSGEIIDKIQGKDITNIGNFSDKRAYVHIGNTFGFINEDAQLVVPLEYELVSGFENGFSVVRKAGKFGLINTTGKAVVPITYDGIGPANKDVIRVKKGRGRSGKWALFTTTHQPLTDFIYDIIGNFENREAIVRRNNRWGVIDLRGKEVVSPDIQCDKLFPFKNGIAQIGNELIVENIAGAPKRRYKSIGYVNRKGDEVIPPKYDYIFDFDSVWNAKDGLARVVKDNLIGFIDATGKEIVPPKYRGIQGFEEAWQKQKGLAKIVNPDGKFGYLSYTGRLVLNPAFSSVDNFEAVLADTNKWARASDNGKFGYINYKGETMISFIYDLISEFTDESAIVKKDGKYGVINKENKLIIPLEYDGIRFLEGSNKTLLKIYKKKPTIYIIDGQGQVVNSYPIEEEKSTTNAGVKLDKYKYLTDFDTNGLAIIEEDKLKGLANTQGKIVVKPKYRQLGSFHDGLAYFQADNKDHKKRKWGYLNLQGKEVIEPTFKLASDFSEGKAAVNNRMWGYIDKTGKLIIPYKYRQASAFSGGYAVVDQKVIIDTNDKKQGEIQFDGEISKGFKSNRAVFASTTGHFHIKSTGLPAYFSKYDEASNFINSIAFVKRGETWELTRKMNDNETKIRFTSAQRNAYLAKFGERYKRKTPFGTMQDIRWEKVKDGFWRMIDKNGNFINESIYDALLTDEGEQFKVRKDGFFGIANLKGEFITPAKNEIIIGITKDIIRVEYQGKIGYLKPDGSWIWELK